MTVASALGTTSAWTWLKMPSCDEPEVVYGATTLPCVVLGGVPGPDPEADLASWGRTLRQDAVRGLVVGRSLLYPPDGDVARAVDAAADILAEAADGRRRPHPAGDGPDGARAPMTRHRARSRHRQLPGRCA